MKKAYHSAAKLTLITLAFAISNAIYAQKTVEVGARTSSFNSFEIVLKKQRKEMTFVRYSLSGVHANFGTLFDNSYSLNIATAGFAFAIGWEKRVSIGKNVTFNRGWEPGLSSNAVILDVGGVLTISPRLGYVLGLQYNPIKQLGISLETIPSLNSSFYVDSYDGVVFSRFGVGYSGQIASLTVVYRFDYTKKKKVKKE
jgi:hypothetical protein